MKFCKDCKHFDPTGYGFCDRKMRVVYDPVSGKPSQDGFVEADEARGEWSLFSWPWECGKRGRFFEPKAANDGGPIVPQPAGTR